MEWQNQEPDWKKEKCSECGGEILNPYNIQDVWVSTFWDKPSQTVKHTLTHATCTLKTDAINSGTVSG